jgi:cytidylate kinase
MLMSQTTLNQIVEQLQTLNAAELQQLNQAVQAHLENQNQAAKQASFHQALMTSGLVRQISKVSNQPSTRHQLVQVQGEPVSQTIVEERR